jgi:hypothetical protein
LLAGPRADLRLLGPRCEIGIRLGIGDPAHGAADADLPPQRLPVEQQGRLGIGRQLAALGAVDMAVEHETVGIISLQQHHAHIRKPVAVHRGQRHGVRIIRLGLPGFGQPSGKKPQGFLGGGKITGN